MKILRFLVPVLVLGVCAAVAVYLIKTKPEPAKRPVMPTTTYVAATRLTPTNFPVVIRSQGVVDARTRSTLIPEVSGKIVEVSPAFRDGSFFEKGDFLLQIDRRDYASAVMVAKATLAQAASALELEKAQSEQARDNWEKLGGGDASPLVLRLPQLAEATARVESARARLEEAERNLERTRIVAPYQGRVLRQRVDLDQFVSPGAVLADIYAPLTRCTFVAK